MQVWRILKERFRDAAFTGEGAKLFAGRWNPAGIKIVYTSTSLALAAIELFVHLDPSEAPNDLVAVPAVLPPGQVSVEEMKSEQLPANWQAMEHGLREIGAEWVRSGKSCALKVPSLAVEDEWNVLLNPLHPEFSKITLGETKSFHFDERMFKVNRKHS